MKKLLMIFSFVAVSAMSYAQQGQRRTFDPEKGQNMWWGDW